MIEKPCKEQYRNFLLWINSPLLVNTSHLQDTFGSQLSRAPPGKQVGKTGQLPESLWVSGGERKTLKSHTSGGAISLSVFSWTVIPTGDLSLRNKLQLGRGTKYQERKGPAVSQNWLELGQSISLLLSNSSTSQGKGVGWGAWPTYLLLQVREHGST